MRPLVLISGLADGGAEHVTVSFLRRLVERDRPAALCTLTDRLDGAPATEAESAGLQRFDLGARRLADPRVYHRYVRLLRLQRFDLVHAHGQDAWILAAAARRAARVPLILTRHVLEESQHGWRQRLRAQAALSAARRADALIAVSDRAADLLAQLAGLERISVRVLRNGVDLERFRARRPGTLRSETRAALGFGPGDRVLLVAAVLRPDKGHETLLEALPWVREAVPGTFLLIVGTGEHETALRQRAASLGDAVRFLGRRNDVSELLAACDVALLPSRSEALPTFLIEAAAAGRAVVATRVGGIPEVVDDGRTGLLVPPDDPAALAGAMRWLLGSPSRAVAMGEEALRRAAERFSLDAQVDATLDVWREVLGSATR